MRLRHASSKGPPVQRMGTHVSGAGEAEAPRVNDIKNNASTRRSHALGGPYEAIFGEICPTANARSRRGLERTQFLQATRTIKHVATDSAQMTKPDRGMAAVLPETKCPNTSLPDQPGKNL